MDTVFDLLRPHRTWYAAVHLGGPWMPPLAMGVLAVTLVVGNLVLDPSWGPAGFAIYFAGLALLLARDWIFPAADIRVEPRRPQLGAPGGWRPERGADAPPAIQLGERPRIAICSRRSSRPAGAGVVLTAVPA